MKRVAGSSDGYYYCRQCRDMHDVDDVCSQPLFGGLENLQTVKHWYFGNVVQPHVAVIGAIGYGFPPASSPWTLNDSIFTGPVSAWCLNMPNRGVASSERIGRSITMSSIRVRGMLYAGTDGIISTVCLTLVYDRAPDYASSIHAYPMQSQSPAALENTNLMTRFITIKRIVRVLAGGLKSESRDTPDVVPGDQRVITRDPSDSSGFYFDEWIDLKGLVTIWDDSGDGRLNHIGVGALFLYAYADNKGSVDILHPDPFPSMEISTVLFYDDGH